MLSKLFPWPYFCSQTWFDFQKIFFSRLEKSHRFRLCFFSFAHNPPQHNQRTPHVPHRYRCQSDFGFCSGAVAGIVCLPPCLKKNKHAPVPCLPNAYRGPTKAEGLPIPGIVFPSVVAAFAAVTGIRGFSQARGHLPRGVRECTAASTQLLGGPKITSLGTGMMGPTTLRCPHFFCIWRRNPLLAQKCPGRVAIRIASRNLRCLCFIFSVLDKLNPYICCRSEAADSFFEYHYFIHFNGFFKFSH